MRVVPNSRYAFFRGELKHEIFWEAVKVALDSFVEVEGFDLVRRGRCRASPSGPG
jgi:hypothetical protein